MKKFISVEIQWSIAIVQNIVSSLNEHKCFVQKGQFTCFFSISLIKYVSVEILKLIIIK